MSTHTHTLCVYCLLCKTKKKKTERTKRRHQVNPMNETKNSFFRTETREEKKLIIPSDVFKNQIELITVVQLHTNINLSRLHHTIDKTDNMSLHINNTRKDDAHTHTNTNDRLAVKERSYLKNTHTHKYRKKKNWCAAMRSYEPEDCIEKKRQNTVIYVCVIKKKKKEKHTVNKLFNELLKFHQFPTQY